MARKMHWRRRNKYNPYWHDRSGILVFFRNRYECYEGKILPWLGFNKYICSSYKLVGDVSWEVVDALINEIYFTNVKMEPSGNATEDLDRCIEAMRGDKAILDGGLVFLQELYSEYKGKEWINDQTTGCCCGMEMWNGILTSLLHNNSPWMGHDPMLGLRTNGETYTITAEETAMLCYSKEEFRKYIKEASDEFIKFVEGPMTDRVKFLCPEKADEFMDAFRYAFEAYPISEEDFEYFDNYEKEQEEKNMLRAYL